MKKSTISAATFDKSFTSKFGTLYQHSITLSNGDSGQLNAKEEMPGWIHPGQTLYYDTFPNGKYPDKIKRITDKNLIEQFDKGNGNSEPSRNPAQYNQIALIESEISNLKEVVKQLVKHTGMKYVAPKKEVNESVGKYEAQIVNAPAPYDDNEVPF